MPRLVYINGKLVAKEKAAISVFDHGLLYGDGVFEGIRVYGRKVFRLEQHLRRLYAGARVIRLDIPMGMAEMGQAVQETVAANSDLADAYIRLVVTRGPGTLGLDPYKCSEPRVIIIVDTIVMYGAERYEKGLEVIIARTLRTPPESLNPRVKSLNYLNNILAKIECHDAGVPEAIMLNHAGQVAEASGDNVFIVRGEAVQTPPLEAGCLEGITRQEVLDICRVLGKRAEEANLRPEDLFGADECFLTGTAAEVIAVTHINGKAVADGRPGRLTRAIREEYLRRTRE